MKKLCSIKLIVSVFMIISLLVTGCLTSLSAAKSDYVDYIKGANTNGPFEISNGQVSLVLNKSNGAITLTDLVTQKQYNSTPTLLTEDPSKTDALSRARGLSQLMIDFINEKGDAQTPLTSNMATSTFATTKDSIIAKYVFENEGFEVTIIYTLDGKSFVASIPLNGIKETGKYTITKLSLLPYFEAGDREDKGYVLVPDGSGALINFNNGKGTTLYSQKVYGTDPIANRKQMVVTTKSTLLPVIGIHKDASEEEGSTGSNILMYVEDGASAAYVNASPSTERNAFNYGYFSFTYRSAVKIKMLENTQHMVEATMVTDNISACESFSVSYNILPEDGDYNDMAEKTREKLIKDGLKSQKISDKVFIEAYMSVEKTKHFLGIPYTANESLTTFDECLKLIEKLGGNVVSILHGLDDDGAIGGSIDTKFDVNSKLGGIDDYNAFVKSASKLGSEVFPVSEFVLFNKSKWGYTTYWNDARSVDLKSIEKLYYLYGNYQENKDYPKLNYLIPTKLVSAGKSYLESLLEEGAKSAAPISIGNTPYSSCDGVGCDLISVENNFVEILSSMNKQGVNVALQNPAAYALNYTKYAYTMPLRSSGYTCFDIDIPFVQLVLNGVMNYGTNSLNLTNNIPEMKLLMLESASAPTYTIIGSEYDVVKDTPLDILYGATLGSLESSIEKEVKEYREFYAKTEGKIAKHVIVSNEIRVVEFENGCKIVINYDNSPVEYEGYTIEAMNYKLIEGGALSE